MINENTNCNLVYTLEDDISGQVLKSKDDEETNSGSSSVALWIKSLKENNGSFDNTNQDYHGYSGSSSDQDDLQLGEEANDVRRRYKSPTLGRDSDSDSNHNKWFSRSCKKAFLTNRLSYDRSLDSDTSGFSSVTSVSSLLTARESDPEDVLRGAGFRGPTVLDKIPDRFINSGTVCDGVDSEQFLYSVQDDPDSAMPVNSEIPPWVMARFDEIPRKFWNQKDDSLESTENVGLGPPLINEPPPDETSEDAPSRYPKSFPSKFGTYLEPVTEEAELSSQGSFTLSPLKTASFESSRSTLKANSQDDQESLQKIPSLCDLWGTTEDDGGISFEAMRSEDHGICSDNDGDELPEVHLPEENKIQETILGSNEDWIDKNRNNTSVSPWSSVPVIADIQGTTADVTPPIVSGPWSDDSSIPALSFYFSENDAPASENLRDSSPDPLVKQVKQVTGKCESSNVNDESITTGNQSCLTIPTVTVSEPVEKTRKISTVIAPDIDKLLPPSDKEGNTRVKRGKKTEVSSARRQPKVTQFNLYNSQKWASVKNVLQPQMQFTSDKNCKAMRSVSIRGRKASDSKVTLSVSRCKERQVMVLCNKDFQQVPCFIDLDVETRKTRSKTSKASSTPASRGLETSETGCRKRSETLKRQERVSTTLPAQQTNEGQEYSGEESDDSKTKYGARLNNGMNIEEELDGLQNSLKGVKMYKAGIHLMQLASSVETVMCSEKRPKRLQDRSSERLLDSIQKELKHLEEYILRFQKQLKGIKKESDKDEKREESRRRESDFSDITRQLLHEQLKLFNSISSAAVSPSSTPSESRDGSLCSETPDVLRHTDVMKLRREMQQLRQDSQDQSATMKEEILGEVRAEIRQCFKEFFETKS
ncbi:uncharacterized protein LOC114525783 [Dendronephthya gigantea]|uniref:uncharacterized protein LOC114525783 n=1 Tax=Dendronephthya gigantea TaxID=151771 RepID=UPI001068F470|nr:uncharacterized protein LOC114525783 [Dendronephthya gigantea]